MRTRPSLALALLASCSGASSRPAVDHAGGTTAPAGPAPTIAWSGGVPAEGGEFAATGLPAVSADGSKVIVAWRREDGGRGMPNLRLVVRDRADAVIHEQVVLDADAAEATTAPPDLAEPNAYLARTHREYGWTPLAAATLDADGEFLEASTWSARGDDLALRFAVDGHLEIKRGAAVVFDRVMDGWLAKDRPMYAGAPPEDTCHNPVALTEVYLDAAHSLVLVRTAYRGNDTCWEPDGEYHVAAW